MCFGLLLGQKKAFKRCNLQFWELEMTTISFSLAVQNKPAERFCRQENLPNPAWVMLHSCLASDVVKTSVSVVPLNAKTC